MCCARRSATAGLVVSDDLEMGGVLKVASIEEAAVGTVQAGADMYLVCHNEELVHRAYEAILKEAERSSRFRTKVETAAKRILAAKRRWPALTASDGGGSGRGNGEPAAAESYGSSAKRSG